MTKIRAITELICKKCGYTWIPRITSVDAPYLPVPKCCPYCKSHKWALDSLSKIKNDQIATQAEYK